MPHPKEGYSLKDGTKVPSVTELLKFKDCGGLMWWSWNEGINGRDYRKTRDKAADAGTLGHAMIEAWAKGGTIEDIIGPEEELAKARGGFKSFLRWAELTNLKIVKQEVILVSEKHRFAGCLDTTLAITVDGQLSLGDWKFAGSIFGEYLMQLAGYAILWEENFPDQPLTGGFHLMRFGKDHCDFTHHSWAMLDEAKEAFLLMRRYYDLKKIIDKRAK